MSSDFDVEKWANDEEAANAFRIVLEAAEGYIANGHEIDSDIMEIALHSHARLLQLEAENARLRGALAQCVDSKTWATSYTPAMKEHIQKIVFRALVPLALEQQTGEE